MFKAPDEFAGASRCCGYFPGFPLPFCHSTLGFILLFDVYVCIQTPHAMSVVSVLRGEKRAWDSLPGVRDSC